MLAPGIQLLQTAGGAGSRNRIGVHPGWEFGGEEVAILKVLAVTSVTQRGLRNAGNSRFAASPIVGWGALIQRY
jgi:hypothetical protein